MDHTQDTEKEGTVLLKVGYCDLTKVNHVMCLVVQLVFRATV